MGFLAPYYDFYTSYNALVTQVIFEVITGFDGFENLNRCTFVDSHMLCGIKIPLLQLIIRNKNKSRLQRIAARLY